jgi:hypothetical protein
VDKVTLSKDSYSKLLQAERGLTDIVAELDNAEKCGIDCQNYRSSLKMQLATIANMKAFYTPEL